MAAGPGQCPLYGVWLGMAMQAATIRHWPGAPLTVQLSVLPASSLLNDKSWAVAVARSTSPPSLPLGGPSAGGEHAAIIVSAQSLPHIRQ